MRLLQLRLPKRNSIGPILPRGQIFVTRKSGKRKGKRIMSSAAQAVVLHTSPHLRNVPAVNVIMRNVVYALIPICLFAVYQFGISVLALLATCVLSCLATEHAICRFSGKSSTVNDWSVTITGLLLALTLPPSFPLWMAVVASVAGVGLGKMFFGGLGYNVMNPALVGRAFAQLQIASAEAPH